MRVLIAAGGTAGHINPALATGPFIQISNDLLGLLIYVWIATFFLGVFGTQL